MYKALRSSLTKKTFFLIAAVLIQSAISTSAWPVTNDYGIVYCEKQGVNQYINKDITGLSIVPSFEEDWVGKREEPEIKPLMPAVLRFPAGMQAMFYDWETGNLIGRDPDIKAGTKILPMKIEDFFLLARRNASRVSYVVNLFQDSAEKTARLARYVKDNGYKVDFWELGNEAHAKHMSERFPDVDTYLKIAREHAEAIKKVFPYAVFGLAANGLLKNKWNDSLAQQTWCNNIIVHYYHGPTLTVRKAMQTLNWYEPMTLMSKRVFHNSRTEPIDINSIFPGKSIWITEWNLIYIGTDVQNNMLHGLWMARMFLRFLRTPEVKMAVYWNMNEKPFGFIYPKSNGFLYGIPYYVFRMISTLINESEFTASSDLRWHGEKIEGLDAQFFLRSDNRDSLLMINTSGQVIAVNLPFSCKVKRCEVELLGGASLSDSNGYQLAVSEALRQQTVETVSPKKFIVKTDGMELPPYAVAVVRTATK